MWYGREKSCSSIATYPPPSMDLKGFIINPSWESPINGPLKIILTILSDGKKVLTIRKY